MSKAIDKSTLGYLGVDFQYRLTKCFFEDHKFFMKIQHIVDQNMFTDETLRRIVGFIKDRYVETDNVPTYREVAYMCRTKINDTIGLETALETISRISKMDAVGMDIIEGESEKFFKQQNLTKAINKAQEIIKRGDFDSYYKIEELIQKALETNTKEDMGWKLFDHIESDLSEDYRITVPTGIEELDKALYGGLGKGELGIIIAPLGVGKAQPLHSKVLTPDGWKRMGNMFVGDEVIGCDGRPHAVLGVYPQGERPVYRITLSNGDTCECDINHLWDVSTDNGNTFRTWSLNEMIEKGVNDENGNRRFVLPRNEAVEFNIHHTKIDPYVLGYYVGMDEHSSSIVVDDRNAELLENELSSSRYVPSEYMFNSIGCRTQVLNGYLEARAYKNGNDAYVIIEEEENVAEQIKFIVRSLGGQFSKNGNKNEYSVRFNERIIETLYVESIESIGDDFTQCIMVDSDEHLYITDDFIVTHNTSCTTGFSAAAATTKNEANNYKGYKVLHFYFEDVDTNIRRKYFGYITDIDACDLSLPETKSIVKPMLTEDNEINTMLNNNLYGERLASGEVSASDLKQKIRKYIARGFKPDLVIVDYFECLKPEKSVDMMDNEWSREGVTMRKLEAMAHEFDVALWVPVQGTKDSIGAEIVGVSQAGGSVKKTQIGHVIITLAQTPEQKTRGRLNLHIGKARVARIGKNYFNNVKFNNGTCKFDMSEDSEDMNDFQYGNMNSQNSTRVAREVMNKQRRNNNGTPPF